MTEHNKETPMSSAGGLGPEAKAIWFKIYPYIMEFGIPYGEAEMRYLCEDVLPEIWGLVLKMSGERHLPLYGRPRLEVEQHAPWLLEES